MGNIKYYINLLSMSDKSQGTTSTIEEVNANLIDLEDDKPAKKSSTNAELSQDPTTAAISEKSEQKIDTIDLDLIEDTDYSCQKLLNDLFNKFNIITESNSSRLKAKDITNDYVVKLEAYIKKLNDEKIISSDNVENCQNKLDEGESEVNEMKNAIKNASIKISTACIDGKMTEYEKLTNEMKKQSEKLNVVNKKRDKIVKEKGQYQKEQDNIQDKVNKANEMLKELIEIRLKSTKLENLDSNSKDASSVKKFINEINEALDGLNIIGAVSLSNEKFNCEKIELPTDLIISSQRTNKSKRNEE